MRSDSRKRLLEIAVKTDANPVAVVFDLPDDVCLTRNRSRPERVVPDAVVRQHLQTLREAVPRLTGEGFRVVEVIRSAAEMDAATFERAPLPSDKSREAGPFDIVGDIHGCLDELLELLQLLGYESTPVGDEDGRPTWDVSPPAGRKLILVGDLVDRGPDTPGVLRLVMRAMAARTAYCVRGNHDDKLARKLAGRDVTVGNGLALSLEQLDREPPEFRERVRVFLSKLPIQLVFDGGRLAVAHAGLREDMIGRANDRVKAFALYGDATGATDESGIPVRLHWAADYRGATTVVYGHTPVKLAEWINGTACVDTACAFGVRLTAVRYPERDFVSVPARRAYYDAKKPIREKLGE